MQRVETFVGACEGLRVAIEHEESPEYREYLVSVVRPFLEREIAQAQEEYDRKRREFELA